MNIIYNEIISKQSGSEVAAMHRRDKMTEFVKTPEDIELMKSFKTPEDIIFFLLGVRNSERYNMLIDGKEILELYLKFDGRTTEGVSFLFNLEKSDDALKNYRMASNEMRTFLILDWDRNLSYKNTEQITKEYKRDGVILADDVIDYLANVLEIGLYDAHNDIECIIKGYFHNSPTLEGKETLLQFAGTYNFDNYNWALNIAIDRLGKKEFEEQRVLIHIDEVFELEILTTNKRTPYTVEKNVGQDIRMI